jgi:hypothetical protein
MFRLNVPSVFTATVALYVSPDTADTVMEPAPVPDSSKSPASTPVTSSLNVTANPSVFTATVALYVSPDTADTVMEPAPVPDSSKSPADEGPL